MAYDKNFNEAARECGSHVVAPSPSISPITSHAQNFEDVLLWRIFGLEAPRGYIDIGAQDPTIDSVSKLFYDSGWRGIHVEANPYFAERLRAERPDETIIQAAVTHMPGPISFYATDENGLSTGRQNVVDAHREAGFQFRRLTVPSIRLGEILKLASDDIAWLKIDVEGMEADVLRSWGRSSRRPPVVLVEATFPNTQVPTYEEWEPLLLSRDYRMVYFDGLSRWYVHRDQIALERNFEASVNIFDRFSVGRFHFSAAALNEERARREQELAAEIAHAAADAAEQKQLRQNSDLQLQAHQDQLTQLAEREIALIRERDQLAFEKNKAEAHNSLQLETLRLEVQKKDFDNGAAFDQVVSEMQLQGAQFLNQLQLAETRTVQVQQRCDELEADSHRLHEQEQQLLGVLAGMEDRCRVLEAEVTVATRAESEAIGKLASTSEQLEQANSALRIEVQVAGERCSNLERDLRQALNDGDILGDKLAEVIGKLASTSEQLELIKQKARDEELKKQDALAALNYILSGEAEQDDEIHRRWSSVIMRLG